MANRFPPASRSGSRLSRNAPRDRSSWRIPPTPKADPMVGAGRGIAKQLRPAIETSDHDVLVQENQVPRCGIVLYIAAGGEEVLVAVVVEIGLRDAHVVAIAGHAGLRGDIGEPAGAIVAVEGVVEFRSRFEQAWNRGAVDEVDIRAAVVVVIRGITQRKVDAGAMKSVGRRGSSPRRMPALRRMRRDESQTS